MKSILLNLRAFSLMLLFFTLSSGDAQPDSVIIIEPLTPPVKPPPAKFFIIPVSKNNAYNKAIAKRLDYRNKMIQEGDTIQTIIDSTKTPQ